MEPYTNAAHTLVVNKMLTYPATLLSVPPPAPTPSSPALRGATRRPAPPLAALLRGFAPITLGDMAEVQLLDRMDTKYVLHERDLWAVLGSLSEQYYVLEIEGIRLHRYQTLYFDTPELALYHQHHAGRGQRYKVRTRQYVDSQQGYLEIKHKNQAGRTLKHRRPTPSFLSQLDAAAERFVEAHLPLASDNLTPVLGNEFVRLTLVGKGQPERLTVDLGLQFHRGSLPLALPGIVIAEVKQPGHARTSPFMQRMREAGIRPHSFSKYCIGVSLLYPAVKANHFKPHHRLLDRLMQGDSRVTA